MSINQSIHQSPYAGNVVSYRKKVQGTMEVCRDWPPQTGASGCCFWRKQVADVQFSETGTHS